MGDTCLHRPQETPPCSQPQALHILGNGKTPIKAQPLLQKDPQKALFQNDWKWPSPCRK